MAGAPASLPGLLPSSVPSFRIEDFVQTACNRAAFELVVGANWSGHCAIVCGPHCCGKTHLGHVWAHEHDALVIHASQLQELATDQPPKYIFVDDADQVGGMASPERSLLWLYNVLDQTGGRLLLATHLMPRAWRLKTSDLQSRLEGCSIAMIDNPDDDLMPPLISKLFTDRRISVNRRLINYLAARTERSHAAVHEIVDRLDVSSLTTKRPIGLPLAREILAEWSL